MAGLGKRLVPLLDRHPGREVRAGGQDQRGGIMIPEKAQAKVQSATVIAVGTGARNEAGQTIPPAVKSGGQRWLLARVLGETKRRDRQTRNYYNTSGTDVDGTLVEVGRRT
uniref:Putative heat shock protein 10 n=1 Tax=Ixodes ricinus TaxID=34613 RepID=V5HBV7_IXORI